MKKIFLVLLLIPLFTYATEVNMYKWSFNIECGFNKFDGDIIQNNVQIIPTSITDFVYGANVEYSFNDKCGISLDYHYIPLKADVGNYLSVRTLVKDVNINGVVNFTQLLFPETKTKISLIGTIGIGVSKYIFNTSGIFPSPQATIASKVDYKYGLAATYPISFAIEYNLSNNIDVGCKINYIAFNKDNLEGLYYNGVGGKTIYKGVSNDYIGLGTVYLKFKVPRKDIKDIDSIYVLPIKKDSIVKDSIKKEYNTYINNININTNNIISNVDTYNSSINNEYDGCVSCRDSAKYSKDNDIDDSFIDSIPSVYFDFDKYFLDYEALKIVKKVANSMLAHPEYYLEIRGYCDHMGDIGYNQVLSNNRVNTVKHHLVQYFNIPENHIIANGHGKIDVPPMKFRLNRRCDFFFFKIK